MSRYRKAVRYGALAVIVLAFGLFLLGLWVGKRKDSSVQQEEAFAQNRELRLWMVQLRYDDKDARKEALQALRAIGEPAIAALRADLGAANERVQSSSAWALEQLTGVVDSTPAQTTAPSVAEDQRDAATQADGRSFAELIKLVNVNVPYGRERAIRSLGLLGDRRAIPALLAILEEKDCLEYERGAAAAALGKFGAAPTPELLKMLESDSWWTRNGALRALAHAGHAEALSLLGKALEDGKAFERDTVIPDVRTRAIWLEKIGKPAWPILLKAVGAEPSGVGDTVRPILEKQMTDADAVPLLIGALKDGKDRVRMFAAWQLGNIAEKSAVGPLTAALQDVRSEVRRNAIVALVKIPHRSAYEVLVQSLRHPDMRVKGRAADALGEIGDSYPVPALMAVLRTEKGHLFLNAERALSKITGKKFDGNYTQIHQKWQDWWDSQDNQSIPWNSSG